jgi:SAM-dependent methyltransferase
MLVPMAEDLNPHARQMADDTMVRNLAAQARAIWPQEAELFRRYDLPETPRILDAGCGTGEIASRLAEMLPRATIVGVDIVEPHLELARSRYGHLSDRLRFEAGDAFDLRFDDGSFDLTVCRHMLQAVPHAERVLRELARVTRPGGRLHLLAEDYGMIHMHPTRLDADRYWRDGAIAFGVATGTDLRVGLTAYSHLHALGLTDISVDYVVVDTVRVPRETFIEIWVEWRDGYADVIAAHTRFTAEDVVAHFDDMIACLRDPAGYAVWHVPVLSAVVPGG